MSKRISTNGFSYTVDSKVYVVEKGRSSNAVFVTVYKQVKGWFDRTKLVYEYMHILPKGYKTTLTYPDVVKKQVASLLQAL